MAKSFVYNAGSAADTIKKDELPCEFGVFIDGTLNNKENTRLRRKYRKEDENSILTTRKKDKDLENEQKDYEALESTGFKLSAKGTEAREYEDYLIGIHRTPTDKLGTNNSYSNDDTNVTRMWNCCKKDYRIYVEGMGTADKEYDNSDGFAFGSGRTGIRFRVREACVRIADNIIDKKKGKNADKKVTRITLDVFGFSRGAASARNFVYEVNAKKPYLPHKEKIPDGFYPVNKHSTIDQIPREKYREVWADADGLEINPKWLIDGKMPRLGHLGYSLLEKNVVTPKELQNIKVVIRFIGVYDTVSSYYEIGPLGAYDDAGNLIDDSKFGKLAKEGWATHFKNDEQELSLHDLGGDANRFEKMVHFTAQDEHRRNFALTRINQIPGKAIEKNLPGVHCDIGGAYENEDVEYIDELGTNISDDKFTNELMWKVAAFYFPNPFPSTGLLGLEQYLIDQHWYKKHELEINWQLGSLPPVSSYKKLSGTRRFIKKEYSYIPLHFMEEFSKQTGMVNFFMDSPKKKYPLDRNPFLETVKASLHKYVFGEYPEWEFVTDAALEQEQKDREEITREMMRNQRDRQDPDIELPGMAIEEENQEETIAVQLPEMKIDNLNKQSALRKLRHEYLHWSSNRDWFGMEPTIDRKRVCYPKE